MPLPIHPRPHLFPATLDAVMQTGGVNQVALAARAGIAVSRVNNYLRGNYGRERMMK